jgi:hypothetical protein
LAQPFLDKILDFGEISMHFFNKKYSHSVLKTPKKGDFRSQEEYGSTIIPYAPNHELLSFGQEVLSKVDETLLYARVDVLLNNETAHLIELELIEPALYVSYSDKAAENFANALVELI